MTTLEITEVEAAPISPIEAGVSSTEVIDTKLAEVFTPSQLFAEHIEYVRQHGDIHSRETESFLTKSLAFSSMAVLGEISTVAGDYELRSLTGAIMWPTLAVPAAVGVRALIRKDHNRKHVAASYDSEAQEALGERYDVYCANDNDVIIHWQGSAAAPEGTEPRPVHESLELLADLANQNQIDHILVDKAAIEVISGHSYQINKSLQPESWLVQQGRTPIYEVPKTEVVELNPAQLRILANLAVNRNRVQTQQVEYIDALRAVDPTNNIVKTYDTYKSDATLLAHKLQLQLRDALSMIAVEPQMAMAKSTSRHLSSERESTSTIQGKDVFTFTAHTFDARPLASALGMGPSDIARILAYPREQPHQYKSLLYVLLYQHAMGMTPAEIRESERVSPPYLFKAPHEAIKLTRRHQALRALGAIASVAAIGIGFTAGITFAREEQRVVDTANSRYSKMIDAGYSEQEAYTLSNQTITDSFAARLYDKATTKEIGIGTWLEGHTRSSQDSESDRHHAGQELDSVYNDAFDTATAFMYPRVGNSYNGDISTNKIDWLISGHNIDTEGYWAASVSSWLNTEGAWYTNDLDGHANVPVQLPTNLPEGTEKYIKVSRPYASGEAWRIMLQSIPVMKGMQPVAANYGGDAVEMIQKEDGTYTVQFSNDNHDSGDLTYWLAPAKSIGPHATQSATIRRARQKTTDTQTIRDVANDWRTALGGELPADPNQRALVEAAYIRQQFLYRYSPVSLPEMSQLRIPNQPLSYIDSLSQYELENAQRANCNVANTLVAVNNPRLNTVVGYYNKNIQYGPNILSTTELHQWLTDTSGTIIDATPTRPDPTEKVPASFTSEKDLGQQLEKQQQNALKPYEPYIAAATGIFVAGLFFGQRKSISKNYTRLQALRGQRSLERATNDQLALAVASVEQVLFAASYKAEGAHRSAQKYTQNRESTLEKLAQTAFSNRQTRKRVRAAMNNGKESLNVQSLLRAAHRANSSSPVQ